MINLKTCIATAIILLVFSAPAWSADKIYKWRTEDGSIVYSDSPPEGVNAQEVQLPESTTPPTAPPPDAARERMLRKSQEIGEKVEQRAQRREALLKELNELNDKIAQALQAMKDGQAPREGETQHLAGGKTKLAPAYFKRLEEQKKALEAMQKRRSELEAELQTLR
jgi:hypothetical protein